MTNNKQNTIPKGYKQSKLGIIPEEWNVCKLSAVLTIKHGKSQKNVVDENGKYPILGTGGLMGYANSFLWDKPSVLIGRKGTIDKPQYKDTPFWTVDTLFYTDIKDNIIPKWMYYKFWTINWKKYNEASGVPSLSASTISSIPIPLPPLPEQKRIAQILTTWDKAISNQQLLIDKYKLKKKGLMQKLLAPKKDWKEVRLGEVCEIKRGGSLSKNQIIKNGKYECIHYGELFTKYNEVIKTILSTTDINGVKSIAGDILMPTSDVTPVGLAKACALMKNNVVLGGDINIIRPLMNINSVFISYLINFEKNKIIKLVTGTTVKHIYGKDVKLLKYIIPNKKNQTQIANILSSADKEIELLEKQLTKLKEQKKGLMQVLLSGQKRVKIIEN